MLIPSLKVHFVNKKLIKLRQMKLFDFLKYQWDIYALSVIKSPCKANKMILISYAICFIQQTKLVLIKLHLFGINMLICNKKLWKWYNTLFDYANFSG